MSRVFWIVFLACWLMPHFVAADTDLREFPKTYLIGIDDGEPPKDSQAQRYLIQPAAKDSNDGWGLQSLLDDYFKEHPLHKKMLNLWDPHKAKVDSPSVMMEFRGQGTALGLFRLRNARHFELPLPGGGRKVVVELGLTWLVMGSEKKRTKTRVTPEVRSSRSMTVTVAKSFDSSIDIHTHLSSLYRKAFFDGMVRLMESIKSSKRSTDSREQMPVMIQKLVLGKKTNDLVEEYLKALIKSNGEPITIETLKTARENLSDELKLYLQAQLLTEMRKDKDETLAKISLLPPKGTLSFLQEDWDRYRTRLIVLRVSSESRLPAPNIKPVGYACEFKDDNDNNTIVRGLWIQAVVARLDRSLDAEDDTQRIYRYTGVSVGQLVIPLGLKSKPMRGLPDMDKPIKSQRIKQAETQVFTVSKKYKETAGQARSWKLLRTLQVSIKKLVPGILKNMRALNISTIKKELKRKGECAY